MPRVSPPPDAPAGDAIRGSALGHQPELVEAFLKLYGILWSRGVVDHPTKEMARLRNARVTGCGYCRNVRFAVDYTYTDAMVNDSLNTENLKRPSVENLNAAIRYLSPSGQFEFVVGGTNLTDERYLVTGSINEAAGEHVGTYSRPREYYATFRYRTE